MPRNAGEVRFAAQSLYQNAPNGYRPYGPPMPRSLSQSASINLYTEDFVSGFMEEGHMSVVRRFFCLFVTFDLIFIALLWLICILINGADIFDALEAQILHYDKHKSLFDIVMVAVCRFSLLIIFYAMLSINHWCVIALSTSGSCLFLIYKVFVFNWIDTKDPVLQVLLIIISFVLAWGETWFLDCRVIPQESFARRYASAMQSHFRDDQRAPLVAPFLDEVPEPATSTFYSPYETVHNSDNEDDAQDDEWLRMGEECVQRAIKLLESKDWLVDRVTDMDDTIRHITLPKIGKVWRVTAKVNLPAKLLLEHLFYKIEDIHKWNTTILESRILHTINNHADITYQVTASAGIIKSRDFVNLRCWRLCRNGQIQSYATDNDDDDVGPPSFAMPSLASTYSEPLPMMTISDGASNTTRATVHRDADDRLSDVGTPSLSVPRSAHRRIEHDVRQSAAAVATPPPPGSANLTEDADAAVRTGLNRSLGASGFFDATDMHSGDEDDFADAEGNASGLASPSQSGSLMGAGADGNGAVGAAADCSSSNVYISAAISLAYDKLPAIPKYTRAENRLSCWAMREIDGKPNACIFEWLMCIDLKGYIPTTLLNQVYPSIIQDYMVSLRKHCEDIKEEHRLQQRSRSANPRTNQS